MEKPAPLFLDDQFAGPAPGSLIIELADLPAHGGKDIIYADGAHRTNIFVQKDGDAVRVYQNRCPHAGTPLNMFGDRFLNIDGSHIICRTHGALFDTATGKCVAGPCKGQYLREVAVEIRDGCIYSL